MYALAAGLAVGSLYFIADELMPSRMSANYLFNEAFDKVKSNHEVSKQGSAYVYLPGASIDMLSMSTPSSHSSCIQSSINRY